MATYFCSAKNGNDANDGLSAATAWATITKAVGEVAAGDTVYIGPGTYREKPSLTTAGTSGNEIRWIPDPEAQYLTTDDPGIVRVTGCDTNEKPTAGAVLTYANYNIWGDPTKKFDQIYIDGRSDTDVNNAIIMASLTGHVIGLHGCTSTGRGLFIRGHVSGAKTLTYCTVIMQDNGIRDCVSSHCLVLASLNPLTGGSAANCVGISRSAFVCAATNCLSILGGFANSTYINCITIAATNGFTGTSAHTFTNCYAAHCNTGFNGTNSALPMNIATCYHTNCLNPWRTGDTWTTANATEGKFVAFGKMAQIIDGLKPVIDHALNLGDNTVTVGDYDILGLARRLGDGTIDIGPYEHSDVTNNFTESNPALEFTQAGMQKFVFWAEGGVAFTKKVSVKWSDYVGADLPQIIVDGDHVTRASGTATGDGTSYEEIEVTATPDTDGEVKLFLYARDTDAAAKTYFKDLE